jgi:amino-acid N-acetyltransferase
MKIELANPNDESRVKQVLLDCGLPNEDIILDHLDHFLILRDDDGLAGVVGLEIFGKCALLRSLAVTQSNRDKGFGTQLTKQAEVYARSKKVSALYLLTLTAEGFFAKQGYQKTDRNLVPTVLQQTTEFKNLCPASAVCMVKSLGAI